MGANPKARLHIAAGFHDGLEVSGRTPSEPEFRPEHVYPLSPGRGPITPSEIHEAMAEMVANDPEARAVLG